MAKYHNFIPKVNKKGENEPNYSGFNEWIGVWEVIAMRVSNFAPNRLLTECSKERLAKNFVTMLMYGK